MSLIRRTVALSAAATLLLGGCGGNGESDEGGQAGAKNVTIEWWHIQNTPPLRPIWEELAKAYQAQHPNVTIKITPIENEAFKAKMTTVTQSGQAPDIFHTWGGGVLKQQVDAGLVQDITDDIASWVSTLQPVTLRPYQIDGKTYGVPFDHGMVGFWYNKALFKRAGIDAPPATWTEFLDAVRKLKAAGITPISLAGKAKWPGHFYWSYLAMRIGGVQAFQNALTSKSFNGPEFVQAGQRLKELVDLAPFQRGFQAADFDTPDGEAATMGKGNAALELMGQWAPAVQREQSGEDLRDDLGFFPFPTVEGGKGAVTDTFGGGNGYAIGRDAPPETIDFVKFLLSVQNQRKATETGAVLPATKGAESSIKDPNIQLVQKTVAATTGFQLYLDQAFPPAVGQEVNDQVAELIAGTKSPEEVTKAITEAAKNE